MRKRPIEVKFRLTEAEYESLQQKVSAAGMNRNAFLVQMISEVEIYPRDLMQTLCQEYQITNRLIRGIGTNINQITKIANSTKAVPSARLLVDIGKEVQIIKNNLLPIWEEARKITWQS